MKSLRIAFPIILVLVLSYSDSTGEGIRDYELTQQSQVQGLLGQKDGPMAKLGRDLAILHDEYESHLQQGLRSVGFKPGNSLMPIADGRVIIDAVASGDANTLKSDLEALGLENAVVFGRIVSGQLPMAAIEDMAALRSLQFARPAYIMTGAGSVTSQGDAAMRSDDARTVFGVDGTGVTVGTVANSFDCLGGAAADVASGDLPQGVLVLEEISDCDFADGPDEGRAMMQIIHDVAPGASLAFHTGAGGQAALASAIIDLANAGADVIVDDLYGGAFQPMFQDGVAAQAVNTVVGMGVAYFSFAGNERRDSYESPFRPSGGNLTIDGNPAGETHDFDPGTGIDILQSITIPEGDFVGIILQWDAPFFSVSGPPGAPNDIDIFLLSDPPTTVLARSDDPNIGGDAVEVLIFENPVGSGVSHFNVVITRLSGASPGLMKYVLIPNFQGTINEFNTQSGTVFGHRNASGAETVGGAFYGSTPEFGVDPALLYPFSSAGPTPILFDTAGNRLPNPEIRQKPEIVAPTGTNNTFWGEDIASDSDAFPNFFGTSAAAPHAAAVAALMLEAGPTLSPNGIYSILEKTADNMGPAGFDFDSGFGLIQADLAVEMATNPICKGFAATIFGDGDNTLTCTPANDIMRGLGGSDNMDGGGGSDLGQTAHHPRSRAASGSVRSMVHRHRHR